jgi:cysteinyl-tRNA synthetase
MSCQTLGETFDIHGGGADLQFPHHENEIAQSEGATGEKFVNYWLHNGFVRVDNEKMSKSLGNFFTVREVLKNYKPEVIRFFILQSHYRSPLNYSDQQLNEANAALTRLYIALDGVQVVDCESFAEYEVRFNEAMKDDFNTPVAISVLFEIAKELNKVKHEKEEEKSQQLASQLKKLGNLLGILQREPKIFLQSEAVFGSINSYLNSDTSRIIGSFGDTTVDAKINLRLEAKKSKNWILADQIRNELKQQGVILEDKPDGTTTWRRE